jgi:hypothetical protein
MKDLRHHRGALTLETTEARGVFDGERGFIDFARA